MNKLYTRLLTLVLLAAFFCTSNTAKAQGWPAQYGGVMLQGFYWDSFADTQWSRLTDQADELSKYFSLVWIPQSGNCDGKSMGYNPKYYWDQNSTFGSEAQLRTLISTLKAKGTGTIADVVINHRANKSNWVDFPAETYNGVTYEMVSTDIVSDDDGGKAAAEAKKLGVSLSQNKDSGEGWDGMRDLDHASANVQKIIKAYEKYLLEDLGYTGFRYDVAKGFAAKYFGIYNDAAKPQFSVGEVWDSNQTIKNWINGTKVNNVIQSAAFDFQFRYQVRDAINGNNWSKIAGSNSLVYGDGYKRYAVTFIENHDTESRSNGEVQDPIRKDTLAANAFMLVMPGTPCVFLKHWQKYKKEIKLMIEVRRMMGIHNESNYSVFGAAAQCTSIQVEGTNGNLIVVVGANAKGYTRGGYKELMSGYKYKYLVQESFDTSGWQAIVDRVNAETEDPVAPSLPDCAKVQEGTYAYFEAPTSWSATINVWAWHNDATHSNVYDGASWPGVSADVTLVGKNNGNPVYLWKYSGTNAAPDMIIFNDGASQTADMTFVNGGYYNSTDGYVATVTDKKPGRPDCIVPLDGIYSYFEKPNEWLDDVHVWAWHNDATHSNMYDGANWPGVNTDVKKVGTGNGKSIYLWKYTGTKAQPDMIIFNDGNGGSQTADLPYVNAAFYKADGTYELVASGIQPVIFDSTPADNRIFSINGQYMGTSTSSLKPGLYIQNGKKIVKK